MEHIIRTERLHLKPLCEADINFIQVLAARPEYFKYDRNSAHPSAEVAERCRWFIESAKALPDKGAIKWIVINNDFKIGEVHVTCNWEETHE